MTIVDARLSSNRKFVICGQCGQSLCRRDQRGRAHELTWDMDWRVVEAAGLDPTHIARTESGTDRLGRGWAPARRGFYGERTPVNRRGYPELYPALCHWARCGALNHLDPKRLDITDTRKQYPY